MPPFPTALAIWTVGLLLQSDVARAGELSWLRGSLPWETAAAHADEQLLRAHGIAPQAEGLRRYFAAIQPCGHRQHDLRQLIDQLGAPAFGTRVHAARALGEELSRQPYLAREVLLEALQDPDEEVRYRAAALLTQVDETAQQLLLAALETVHRRQVSGLAAELLAALPYCRGDAHQTAAERALAATLQPQDIDELWRVARSSAPDPVRQAAILALSGAEENFPHELLPFLEDKRDNIRLAAARAIAVRRPEPALPVAAELLESESPAIRATAAALLREATGQRLGFSPYAPAEVRGPAVARWRQWLQNHSRNPQPLRVVKNLNIRQERVLVCTFNPFRVLEIGLAGDIHFAGDEADSACGGVRLENGQRVLADWGGKALVMIDRDGRRMQSIDLPGTPNGLDLLSNGEFLVPLFHERALVAVAPTGQITWRIELDARPTDARRLSNGNTLVALNSSDRVVEINSQGEVLWSIENIRGPESARRLDNGNTLVAARGGVSEFDPQGGPVWTLSGFGSPYDAVPLDNGNLLIGHSGGMREVDRDGQVFREYPLGTVRRIHYY